MSFQSTGFEIIADVLPAAACQMLIERTESLNVRRAGSRQLLQLDWCMELAAQVACDCRLQKRLAGLIPVQCTYFHKSPRSNWLVAHHQDLSIPVRSRVPSKACRAWSEKQGVTFVQPPTAVLDSMVAVRLHLDDSDADNGPLRVVSGSHLYGQIEAQRAAELRERLDEVVCVAPRGSALLFKPLLLHASSKATSVKPRRVLHFLFGPVVLPAGLRWRTDVQQAAHAEVPASVALPPRRAAAERRD